MHPHRFRHHPVSQALVLNSGNLGQRVVSGASFTLLGIALRTGITIGSMAVLARLLTPADFGFIAMATVVTEFAGLLGSFGFANILVQRARITRLQLDTIFWAALGIGSLIAAVIFALSFATGWLFNSDTVGGLLRVMCLTFVFGSLTTVHEAILARLMWFRLDFYVQIASIVVRSVVAILFALWGHGVWSLVAGPVVAAVVTALVLFAITRYVPRWRFDMRYLAATWKTSSSYLGNTILYYLNMNVDLMLIGRSLGASQLGFYQNARSLTDEVRGRIAMPLQRVLFPAFSAIQHDPERLRQSVRRSGRLLAAIICPVGMGLAAVAEEIVPVLYGEQWLAMIPILSLLGLSAALRGSTATGSSLFNAQNKVELAFRYNLGATVLLLASVILALPHGLDVVAMAIAANSLVSVLIFRVAIGLIGMDNRDLLHILARPLGAAALMWLAIAALRPELVSQGWSPAGRLVASIATGAASYALLLHLSSRQYYADFRDLAGRLLKKT